MPEASVKLTHIELGRLHEALLDAYRTRGEVEQMLKYKMGMVLNRIPEVGDSSDLNHIFLKVIAWAEANGQIFELVFAAHNHNRGNPALHKFITGLPTEARQHIESFAEPVRPAYELMQISEFDLKTTLEDAHLALAGTSGVVGVGIPCEELEFFDHFCKRLHSKLGNRVAKKTQYPLGPPYSSVAEAIEAFGDYKSNLKKQDVLCPVQVIAGNATDADALVSSFWQGIKQQYVTLTEHRLMLILVGPCDLTFPPDVTTLDPVSFNAKHIYSYVLEVVGHLQWPDSIAVTWRESTLAYARRNGVIKMRRVYEHLELTLESLRGNANPEQFRAFLQEGV